MDAEKEKRFRFQMQLEQEKTSSEGPRYSETQSDEPGAWEAAGRGAIQGASMGFGDEIYGAYKGLTEDGNYDEIYRRERDAVRANNDRAREAHGLAYGTGEIGAGLATAFIPGAAPATLGRAAAFAAGSGALNAVGNSESENIRDIGKEAAVGAAFGGAAGGLGYGIGKGVGGIVDKLKGGLDKGANSLIAKHVMSPQDFGKAASRGEVQKMGQAVFDEGLTSPFSGRGEIGRRAGDLLDGARSTERQILASTPRADVGALRDRVQRAIVDPAVAGGRGHSVAPVKQLLGSLDDVGGQAGGTAVMRPGRKLLSGEELNELKHNWQGAFRSNSDRPSAQALKGAARVARIFEEEHVGKHAAGRLPEFLEAKGRVMIGAKVKDGMEYAAQNPSNDLVKGAIATGGAAMVGGPVAAVATAGGAVAKHMSDGRGTTAMAHAMKALGQKDHSKFRSAISKALSRNPMFLGKAGAKIQQALMEDSDQPGSNSTARVAFEEQSNPALQRLLKEEREQ